jgi:Protein of unknown function (DUF1161)
LTATVASSLYKSRKGTGSQKPVLAKKGVIMKGIALSIAVVFLLCSAAFAAVKPCGKLKAEIESKLKEKGVQGYTLEVVPAGQVKDQKVIGSCEGGSKKITYSRGDETKAKKEEEK